MEFKLPRWDELPDVSLYLDQVLSLLDQWLGGKLPGKNKPVMTKMMINNYVRQKIISPPVKKRYEKKTVAALFLIAYLKEIFSIQDIARLIATCVQSEEMSKAYDSFCASTERAVAEIFNEKKKGDLDYLMDKVADSIAGCLFTSKMYLEKPVKYRYVK